MQKVEISTYVLNAFGKVCSVSFNTSKQIVLAIKQGAVLVRDTRLVVSTSKQLYCGFPVLNVQLLRKAENFSSTEIQQLNQKVQQAIEQAGDLEKLPVDANNNYLLTIDFNGQKLPVILGKENNLDKVEGIVKTFKSAKEFVEDIVKNRNTIRKVLENETGKEYAKKYFNEIVKEGDFEEWYANVFKKYVEVSI